MKKYIVEKLKGLIEEKKFEWAQNYVAKKYQEFVLAENPENAEAQKQVDSADINMATILKTVAFLENLQADESKTVKTKRTK